MRIGLIGFGSIGGYLGKNLARSIAWVVDRRDVHGEMRTAGLRCPLLGSLPSKCGGADLVVEAAEQGAVPLLAGCLRHCDVMVMSVGALADEKLCKSLVNAAKKHRRKIYLPSGAIGGLDAISAVSSGIEQVILETSKPPHALGRKDRKRTVVFDGSAKEACRIYPKNINVSATLALAGVGFDRTRVRIISDPSASKNKHRITVVSSAGRMVFEFENEPSGENPKTSALAALSALCRIRRMEQALQIG